MKSRILVGSVAIVMAVIVAVGAFGTIAANAQAPRPTTNSRAATQPAAGQPVRLAGKISNATSTGITLTSRRGDFTVIISADTFITVEKNGQIVTGAASDLVADKATLVVGTATADAKVVNARLISQGGRDGAKFRANHPKARQALNHTAAGTITAINGTTITLKGVKVANVTVETSADTVVLNNGFTTVSSLKVGDKVSVFGKPDKPAKPAKPANGTQLPDSRTITAWGLRVDNGTTQVRLARVDTVSGNSLTARTIKNRDGSTIQLDANTAYKTLTVSGAERSATLTNASQADVQAGSNLIVEGAVGADGKTITATAVIILPAGKLR